MNKRQSTDQEREKAALPDKAKSRALSRKPSCPIVRHEPKPKKRHRSASALNAEALQALRDDGYDMNELIELFMSEAANAIAEIREAVGRSDRGTIAFQAHRLKGSAATFGARVMCELCQALQQAGDASEFATARALFDQLASECDLVCIALASERAAPSDDSG